MNYLIQKLIKIFTGACLFGAVFFAQASLCQMNSDEQECREYQIGESRYGSDRDLNKNKFFYDDRTYSVKRDSENTYSLYFSLRFQSESRGSQKNSEEYAMIEKVQSCFSSFNAGTEGDGLTKILLKFWQPSTGALQPRTVEISVGYTTSEHPTKYNSSIDCNTILHEVFHLTGLVDEYDDNQFSCRATAISIMGNQRNYFENGQFKKYENPGEIVCGCPEYLQDKSTCVRKLQTISAIAHLQPVSQCPAETIQLERSNLKVEQAVSTGGQAHTVITDGKVRASYIERLNTSKWKTVYALRPAHVRAILFPKCSLKNKTYFSCARNSYESNKCYQSEPVCQTQDKWLD